jgi:hypothetical protein
MTADCIRGALDVWVSTIQPPQAPLQRQARVSTSAKPCARVGRGPGVWRRAIGGPALLDPCQAAARG